MKQHFSNFRLIWCKKNGDLKQWGYYNIVLGLLPIWLSWVPLVLGLKLANMLTPLFDGSALIFAATLTAASVSFFQEESKRELKETQRFLWRWLFIVLIVSSAVYTAIIAFKEFAPSSQICWVNGLITIILLIAACFLNFYLAAIRLAYSDNELVAELLKSEPTQLSKAANDTKNVDGINL